MTQNLKDRVARPDAVAFVRAFHYNWLGDHDPACPADHKGLDRLFVLTGLSKYGVCLSSVGDKPVEASRANDFILIAGSALSHYFYTCCGGLKQ